MASQDESILVAYGFRLALENGRLERLLISIWSE
jgi:hypothetical protein